MPYQHLCDNSVSPACSRIPSSLQTRQSWLFSRRPCSRKRAVIFFGWVFFLISLGSPHVRPMGRTCGKPNEIELTPIGVKLNGSRRAPLRWNVTTSTGYTRWFVRLGQPRSVEGANLPGRVNGSLVRLLAWILDVEGGASRFLGTVVPALVWRVLVADLIGVLFAGVLAITLAELREALC